MKRWFFGFLLALVTCFVTNAQMTAEEEFELMSADDQELLISAKKLVDSGMYDAATTDFDYLVKKYPKNFMIAYERLFNLYHLGKFEAVIKDGKKLLKHKNASQIIYQMIGNVYDIMGNSKEALKIYNEGLKRYPESGSLNLEIGNVYLLQGDYEKALINYGNGIIAQPNFASNYYRAAQLYFNSEAYKVWGLVYAETEILLAPSNEARHKEMAAMIVDCFNDNIVTEVDGDKKTITVNLVPSKGMNIDMETKTVRLAFPGIYESCITLALVSGYNGSLSDLISMRKGAVEAYFSIDENGLYGDAMYLLDFQKKVIDAGHWEAYNYFLFAPVFEDEFEQWYEDNDQALDAFIKWYNDAPFALGGGRSVDPMQIYRYYPEVSLIRALGIQAKLLNGKDVDLDKLESEVNAGEATE